MAIAFYEAVPLIDDGNASRTNRYAPLGHRPAEPQNQNPLSRKHMHPEPHLSYRSPPDSVNALGGAIRVSTPQPPGGFAPGPPNKVRKISNPPYFVATLPSPRPPAPPHHQRRIGFEILLFVRG